MSCIVLVFRSGENFESSPQRLGMRRYFVLWQQKLPSVSNGLSR